MLDFYPRPPRGGRRGISVMDYRAFVFLSTPSARRATRYDRAGLHRLRISIHALREEGDLSGFSRVYLLSYFYPRPPRGGRPRESLPVSLPQLFLSTPSARRATPCAVHLRCMRQISIHALREEGDLTSHRSPCATVYFYPRPPRGGRPPSFFCGRAVVVISIHALREEGDVSGPASPAREPVFLSTPSARRATQPVQLIHVRRHISIHALREEGDPA